MLEDRILSCLSHVLKCEITPEDYQRNPVEELEMDSVLILELIIQIEDEFQITFSDFSALSDHMDSLGELIEYLIGTIEEME